MLEQFKKLVDTTVEEGYSRANELYLQNLEESLIKQEIFESYGLDNVINHLIQESITPSTNEEKEETPVQESTNEESINEDAIDKALAQLEKEVEDL